MSADGEKTDLPAAAGRPDEELASETAPRRVGFPYWRMVMAAVGLVLSVWLWVGESWRFDVTPEELVKGSPGWGWKGGWVGRYVNVVAFETSWPPEYCPKPWVILYPVLDSEDRFWIAGGPRSLKGLERTSGRLLDTRLPNGTDALLVDTTRGRWTAKSVIAVFISIWGVGIIVSSVWVWKKKCDAAATATCDDAPAKRD